MGKLFIYYDSFYQMVDIKEHQTITIGNTLSDTVTIQALPLKKQIKVVAQSKDELAIYEADTLVGTLDDANEVRIVCGEKETSVTFMYQSESKTHHYYTGAEEEIALPNDKQAHFFLYKFANSWYVYPVKYPIYLNGEQISDSQMIDSGDILFCNGILYTLHEADMLTVQTAANESITLPVMKKPTT